MVAANIFEYHYYHLSLEMVPEYENAFVLIIVSHNEHRTFPTYPFLIKDLHVKKEDFINDIVSSIENATAKEVDSVSQPSDWLFPADNFLSSRSQF